MDAFTLLMAGGTGVGLWRVTQNVASPQVVRRAVSGLLALAGGLLGARAGFTVEHWQYLSTHLVEIPRLWLGGLSWPGAIIGALLVTALLAWEANVPFLRMTDQLAPLVPPLAVAAWIGCWLVGNGYGTTVPQNTWWGIISLDETGAMALRFPVQPLATISLVAYYGLLEYKIPKRIPMGANSSLCGLGLAVNLFLFSLVMVDTQPVWMGLHMDSWSALLFCVVCFFTFAYVKWGWKLRKRIRTLLPNALRQQKSD
ncbi:MAG TPA: prolipoprotein diacylglyceryl transferase family protein [Longilinea sp.]|nr:prolipoprotein diacylglyceryl transferase family protein [Longilinea sp.]